MASRTLEREVEVVTPKEVPTQEAVVTAAKSEDQERVEGSGMPFGSRAWNSQAQID